MYRREQISNYCFNNKRITKKLFYNNNTEYYNSSETNFKRILEKIVLETGVINMELLQKCRKANEASQKKERNKITVFNKMYKIGIELLNEEKDKYFIGNTPIMSSLKDRFYIKKKAAKNFIDEILIPLIRVIDNGVDYEWKKLENKKGYWRELNENETVPVGSEVSMNFTTNKNMIKL